MDTTSPRKRQNRRQRKDAHKHTHRLSKWIDPNLVTRDILNKASLKVASIYCYKYNWSISGTIWDGVHVNLENGGEYRSELSYESGKPIIIGDLGWTSAYLTFPDGCTIHLSEIDP